MVPFFKDHNINFVLFFAFFYCRIAKKNTKKLFGINFWLLWICCSMDFRESREGWAHERIVIKSVRKKKWGRVCMQCSLCSRILYEHFHPLHFCYSLSKFLKASEKNVPWKIRSLLCYLFCAFNYYNLRGKKEFCCKK